MPECHPGMLSTALKLVPLFFLTTVHLYNCIQSAECATWAALLTPDLNRVDFIYCFLPLIALMQPDAPWRRRKYCRIGVVKVALTQIKHCS